MSLTFYYAPMSTASVSHLVIEELGVPCEKVKLDLKAGDAKKPEYTKLNPNAKVPLIVHDGVPIFESAAITMYLGETFGVEKKLYPAAGPKRGEAMKWIVWANVTLGETIGRLMRNTSDWVPAEQRNAKVAEVAKGELGTLLGIVDTALEGKQFLLGDFTLVDAHLSSFCDWLGYSKFDLSPYKKLSAWLERCHARPANTKLRASGNG